MAGPDVGPVQLHFQSLADRNCADAGAYSNARFRYTIDDYTQLLSEAK